MSQTKSSTTLEAVIATLLAVIFVISLMFTLLASGSDSGVLSATDVKSERAKRLSHDLEEQVHRLNDLLHALEDVYNRDLKH